MAGPIGAITSVVSLIQGLDALTADDTPTLPAPPEIEPAPKAPNVATADDVAADSTPAVARSQSFRRRRVTNQNRLFSLDADQNTSSILSRTLLGR